jgi:CRP-like cAMP-binding protein
LSSEFWSRLNLDNSDFLSRVGLFKGMSPSEIERYAARVEKRVYQRSEVILWQGQVSDHLYIIKSGIVGITRISPKTQDSEILNYMREGDMLGEYSLLAEQNRAATATATALTEVETLVMDRAAFYDLLTDSKNASIELSRMLVQRILSMNARLSSTSHETNLCIVYGMMHGAGCTMLGNALAMVLANTTQKPSVYSEYGTGTPLSKVFNFGAGEQVFKHSSGHDIYLYRETPGMPANVNLTLFMDYLTNAYTNIVIGLPPVIDEVSDYMLERAGMVLLLTPPTMEAVEQVTKFNTQVKPLLRPEKTALFYVVNHPAPIAAPFPIHGDFSIDYIHDMRPIREQTLANVPESLSKAARMLADRLGRTNQISLYIPSTIYTDQGLDSNYYVSDALGLLGRLFGGATSSEARGVWNSEQVGLVNETVYIVRSYATQADMERCLPDVLAYMEHLKRELRQEAMALEVNEKFMLI